MCIGTIVDAENVPARDMKRASVTVTRVPPSTWSSMKMGNLDHVRKARIRGSSRDSDLRPAIVLCHLVRIQLQPRGP